MCYRKSVPGVEVIEKKFKKKFFGQAFNRIYEVSPVTQTKLPVITNEKPDQIQLFSWGLIPFWVKNQKQADDISTKTANARGETIYEKPSFRNAAKSKHCLIIADGFFEWRHIDGGKYPYYIRLKSHEPFAFAGLYENWKNPETEEIVNTYTIITTEANPMMQIIHNAKKECR